MKRVHKSFVAFAIFLLVTTTNSSFVKADAGGDSEIEVTWTNIKKPSAKHSYPKCKVQIVSITPKRSFLGIGLNVKDKNGEVIGWNGNINLNLPANQISQLPIKFCYPLNLGKKVKNPLKLEVFLKYSYLDPERGSTRTLEIPYKFKK